MKNQEAKLESPDVREAANCSACRGTLFRTEHGEGALFPTTDAGKPAAFGGLEGPRVHESVVCISCGATLEPTVAFPPSGRVMGT